MIQYWWQTWGTGALCQWRGVEASLQQVDSFIAAHGSFVDLHRRLVAVRRSFVDLRRSTHRTRQLPAWGFLTLRASQPHPQAENRLGTSGVRKSVFMGPLGKAQPLVKIHDGWLVLLDPDLQFGQSPGLRLGQQCSDQLPGQTLPPKSSGYDQAANLTGLAPYGQLRMAYHLSVDFGHEAADPSLPGRVKAPPDIVLHLLQRRAGITMALQRLSVTFAERADGGYA
jgi:hypothetical protein